MMCSVEIAELGRELRARRAAAGRTIASVAADAGLSVPYIANLENGRGNPTLSALAALSRALGADLIVDLGAEPDHTPGHEPGHTPLPSSLIAFARSPRFAAEAAALETAGTPAARPRLLHALAAMSALSPRPLTDLDWHRLLDAAVLISRAETPAAPVSRAETPAAPA
jgi:transcriptional regulator with XRE-family HTH domain